MARQVEGNQPVRYFVTGAAGFIGSHLVDALRAQGHEVWALDDLSTGHLDNLKLASGNPGFHFQSIFGCSASSLAFASASANTGRSR